MASNNDYLNDIASEERGIKRTNNQLLEQIAGNIGGGSESNRWGVITGDLTEQTDLQNALDAKADVGDLDDYVLKAGDTMTGPLSINYNSSGISQFTLEGGASSYRQTFRNGNGYSEWLFGNSSNESQFFSMRLASNTVTLNTVNNRPLVLTANSNSSSGTHNATLINPTINQSGIAGYNALLVNVTETSTGSGAKHLLSARVGDQARFRVFSDGRLRIDTQNPLSSLLFEAAGYGVVGSDHISTFLVRNTGNASPTSQVSYRAQLNADSGPATAMDLQASLSDVGSTTRESRINFQGFVSNVLSNVFTIQGNSVTAYGTMSLSNNRLTNLANGTNASDAVNLSQLDARLSPAQRTAINALTSGASTMDIVNALQAT